VRLFFFKYFKIHDYVFPVMVCNWAVVKR